MQEYNYFLHPNPSEPHYIARSKILRALGSVAPKTKGRVLDIGCGEFRGYEGLFKPYVDEYLCLDRMQKESIDICSDCYNIPLENNSFDTVLSTQVLEHLESPNKMISESYRLLKPGGLFIMTVPMTWGLHEEPYDFYRYTKYGIKHFLVEAGYTEINVEPLEGLFASLIQLLVDEYYAVWHSWNKKVFTFVIYCLNKLGFLLDEKFPTQRLCLTYISTARKPGN